MEPRPIVFKEWLLKTSQGGLIGNLAACRMG
jgi:hypothetical protein